jgi:hypothetical protein
MQPLRTCLYVASFQYLCAWLTLARRIHAVPPQEIELEVQRQQELNRALSSQLGAAAAALRDADSRVRSAARTSPSRLGVFAARPQLPLPTYRRMCCARSWNGARSYS